MGRPVRSRCRRPSVDSQRLCTPNTSVFRVQDPWATRLLSKRGAPTQQPSTFDRPWVSRRAPTSKPSFSKIPADLHQPPPRSSVQSSAGLRRLRLRSGLPRPFLSVHVFVTAIILVYRFFSLADSAGQAERILIMISLVTTYRKKCKSPLRQTRLHHNCPDRLPSHDGQHEP